MKEGVKEFYDYDVALIQLEEDVQISSAVRWGQKDLDLMCLPLQLHFMHVFPVSGLFAFRAPRKPVARSAWSVTRPASSKVRWHPWTRRSSVYTTWDSWRAKVPLQTMPNWSPEVCILQVFACMMWHTCRSGSDTGRQSCSRCSINNGFEVKTKSQVTTANNPCSNNRIITFTLLNTPVNQCLALQEKVSVCTKSIPSNRGVRVASGHRRKRLSDLSLLSLLHTEEELLRTHLEKLNFLTKKSSMVQEKEVHAKLGDNVSLEVQPPSFALFSKWEVSSLFSTWQRDECIRYALEAEGVTTTNPKIPVTDNFLCTGGQLPFRDHIACTGMLFHRYTNSEAEAFSTMESSLVHRC